MTNEEREKWRWTFAGQAMQCLLYENGYDDYRGRVADHRVADSAVMYADALIAKLEESAVKECRHAWVSNMPHPDVCRHCGEQSL